MHVLHVVGARPNFVKMAPVIAALRDGSDLEQRIVHTGQHYDARMSREILDDLDFPLPDHQLGVGSGSQAEQTARVLERFEGILLADRPNAVVVAGDVNSTLGCALAASKLGIPIAHVESGLRSFDPSMPEETNRMLTDRLSTWLFTHSPEAEDNLAREGMGPSGIYAVGNTMIDSLRRAEPRARRRAVWSRYGLPSGRYLIVTLHRPSNVDDPDRLAAIAAELAALGPEAPVLFPVHPRTRARLDGAGLLDGLVEAGVRCVDPLAYIDFLSAQWGAGAVLTDSGGVQEETSALGVACYTLRPNTERPVTISLGTNTLIGDDPRAIAQVRVRPGPRRPANIPGWDGRAGERVAGVLGAALVRNRATDPAQRERRRIAA